MTITARAHAMPWSSLPLVVLDFETTDADPASCMPVEMALVRVEAGEITQTWSTLVNPQRQISEGAFAVHGISNDDVSGAPSFETAWAEACDRFALSDAVPCAYSAQFDRTILRRLAPAAAGHTLPILDTDWEFLDPLVIIRHVDRFVRGSGRHRLGNVCERHGVKHESAHRALGDAEATGRLLFAPVIRDALGDMTIGEVLRKQQLRAEEQERDFQAWKARQPQREEAVNG